MNSKILLGGIALLIAWFLAIAIFYEPTNRSNQARSTCATFCKEDSSSEIHTYDQGVCICKSRSSD